MFNIRVIRQVFSNILISIQISIEKFKTEIGEAQTTNTSIVQCKANYQRTYLKMLCQKCTLIQIA